MEWIRASGGARQRLWLLLGVVAVALSLLALHQLSSNHTAAGPARDSVPATTESAHLTLGTRADPHAAEIGGSGHVQLSAPSGTGHPAADGDGCPGCTDHSAMALTCLAALVLMVVGWKLLPPRPGRVRRERHQQRSRWSPDLRSWVRRPRSLAELAVSRI